MTLVDFDAGLRALAMHAPHLRSLAVQGLELSEGGLVALAGSCVRLERAHLVGCTVEQTALARFLASAARLAHLELAYCVVHRAALLGWLETREVPPARATRLGAPPAYTLGLAGALLEGSAPDVAKLGRLKIELEADWGTEARLGPGLAVEIERRCSLFDELAKLPADVALSQYRGMSGADGDADVGRQTAEGTRVTLQMKRPV